MYLIDTHVLLWALREQEKLSATARNILIEPANVIQASAASFYEIHLKVMLGKIAPLHEDLAKAVDSIGFSRLSISPQDATIAAQLPLVHRDPWDRLLVAQSLRLGLRIISIDDKLDALGANRLW